MTASQLIDQQIANTPGWRGNMIAKLRKLILETDPSITEEWKWDVGVWTHNGMVCAVSAFKDHVKINFFQGAKLQDPHKLLNAGLQSKSHRSIDFYENDAIRSAEVKDLIHEAIGLNA